MDLYVERQAVEQMKQGNLKQFMLLFDAYFEGLYRYVARRVADGQEVERIVRLTFLDALGQVQSTPNDTSYLVWLYSLARPRVWKYLASESMPDKQGLIARSEEADEDGVLEQAEKMFGKLSLEEREILRLKFFEELADGDVMMVIAAKEGEIGAKIYRVLKRAHFLLFGESDGKQGVYFGELSGFLERMREVEGIEVPEVLKLTLKMDLSGKIDAKDFAIEGEEVVGAGVEEVPAEAFKKPPVEIKDGEIVGSDDPAKVFVEAVKNMREQGEEFVDLREDAGVMAEDDRIKEQLDFERSERIMDFFDRWKHWIACLPALAIVFVAGVFVWKFVDLGDIKSLIFGEDLIVREDPSDCSIEAIYEGDFSDALKNSVDGEITDRLCDYFLVNKIALEKAGIGVAVELDVPGRFLEYEFVNYADEWRIDKFRQTSNSDWQSREV